MPGEHVGSAFLDFDPAWLGCWFWRHEPCPLQGRPRLVSMRAVPGLSLVLLCLAGLVQRNADPQLLRKGASGLLLLKVVTDPLLVLAQMSWSCAVLACINASPLMHAGHRGKVPLLPALGTDNDNARRLLCLP